jgi:hypothetical protein
MEKLALGGFQAWAKPGRPGRLPSMMVTTMSQCNEAFIMATWFYSLIGPV